MLDVSRELRVELSHLVDTLPPPKGDGDRARPGNWRLLSVRSLTGAPAGDGGLALLQNCLVGTKTEETDSDVATVADLFPCTTQVRLAYQVTVSLPGIKEEQHWLQKTWPHTRQ